MSLLSQLARKRVEGPEVEFHCPRCGPETPAESYRLEEKVSIFFMPIFTFRNTFVACRGCGARRNVDLPLGRLGGLSADALEPHLSNDASFVFKLCAVLGAALFFTPVAGLALSLVGLVGSLRSGGWPKIVSIVGVVLGAVATAYFLYMTYVVFTLPQGRNAHRPFPTIKAGFTSFPRG